MSDDDSSFAIGGGVGDDQSDSSGFAVGGRSSSGEPVAKRRRGKARDPSIGALTSITAFAVFLVVDSCVSAPSGLMDKWAHSKDRDPHFDGDLCCVVALAYISFLLRRPDEIPNGDDMVQLQNAELHRMRRRSVEGFLDYSVDKVFPFDEPLHLPDRDHFDGDRRLLTKKLLATMTDHTCGTFKLHEVFRLPGRSRSVGVVRVSNILGELLVKDLSTAAQCVLLSKRMRDRHDDILFGFPTQSQIHSFQLMSSVCLKIQD